MRKLILSIALVALLVAGTVHAAVTTLFSAKTTTYTSASTDTGAASYVRVQVYSATTSTSTVLIEQSTNASNWYVVATITDASSTGEIWSVPSIAYTRVRMSAISAGAVSATIEVQR